ncbi:MAG: hypothetical protein M1570_01585 [Chloroflexi bacterium]|nr:hypothetical protein [Chloroflexota bacterium]
MIPFALLAALGFDALYAETAYAHTQSAAIATAAGLVVFLFFGISFLLPPQLFRYTDADPAPRVMSQVVSRAFLGSVFVIAGGIVVGLMIRRAEIGVVEELYMYTLTAVLLFHVLAGAAASHVVYLQATRQYNSNQLVAILVMITLVLLILILYFLAFDLALPRDAYIHVRDLTLVTLVLLGYGRAMYLMAHH